MGSLNKLQQRLLHPLGRELNSERSWRCAIEYERSLFAKLAHVAVFYVMCVDEPVSNDPSLATQLLARSLYSSWGDVIEADPKCKRYANRIIKYARRYRERKISVEKAVAGIERARLAYSKTLGS